MKVQGCSAKQVPLISADYNCFLIGAARPKVFIANKKTPERGY